MAQEETADHEPLLLTGRHRRTPTPRKSRIFVFIIISFIIGLYIGNLSCARNVVNIVKSSSTFFTTTLLGKEDAGSKKRKYMSPLQMLGVFYKGRKKLEARLMEEYGEWYGHIFDPNILQKLFVISDESKRRLQIRIAIKVLSAQVGVTEDYYHHEGGGNNDVMDVDDEDLQQSTFTWVTGGDSGAAGHGNLFKQSYTAILEDTLAPIFNDLGVSFVAKNRAIGGMNSAPELAMCMEAIYGSDIDILNWDFARMDGPAHYRSILWGHRAAIHPSTPFLFMTDHETSGRWKKFSSSFDGKGVGVGLMNNDVYRSLILQRLPDSGPLSNLSTLPESLAYFVCNGHIEGSSPCDDPLRFNMCDVEEATQCQEHKWNTNDVCPGGTRYQTSWHSGWKGHLLRGRLLGYFLLDTLQDTLIEIEQWKAGQSYETLLDALVKQEFSQHSQYFSWPPDADSWEVDRETVDEVGINNLYRKEAICHSALLPSEARFDGAVLQSGLKGDEKGGYEVGENMHLASNNNGALPLVFDPNDRQQCSELEIDHKDFFSVKDGDGWLELSLPTLSQMKSYIRDEETVAQREGYIMVCLKTCPLGRCPDAVIGFGKIRHDKKLWITVDDTQANSIQRLDTCHFLGKDDGTLRWGERKEVYGQYLIRFRVEDPARIGAGHWLRISSIIII